MAHTNRCGFAKTDRKLCKCECHGEDHGRLKINE